MCHASVSTVGPLGRRRGRPLGSQREPEVRYGSAPVTLLMPYLIGQKKTRELLFTGDLIDAVEAERIGLVNRVVPADRLAAEVDALADRLARTPPEVMAPTKAMLNRAMDAAGFRLAVEAGLDLGAIINAADTPEQREWDEIVRRDGLKAALAWRDKRYDERLGGGGGAARTTAEAGPRGDPPTAPCSDREPPCRPVGRASGALTQRAKSTPRRVLDFTMRSTRNWALTLVLSYWYTFRPHAESAAPGGAHRVTPVGEAPRHLPLKRRPVGRHGGTFRCSGGGRIGTFGASEGRSYDAGRVPAFGVLPRRSKLVN